MDCFEANPMTSRSFFTADTHFGHEGVIKFSNRPFASVTDMDETLIRNWNAVVRPDDTVWHVGDFAHHCGLVRLGKIFSRLHGKKHLLVGNHDDSTLELPWSSTHQIAEVAISGQRLVLCHYAMRIWPGQRKGAIHLFGHSHGRYEGTSRSLDVGVDSWGYCPVDLRAIFARLRLLPNDDPERLNAHPFPAESVEA